MMKLVTRKEMQAMDRIAIEKRGIPSLSLMENAGRGVAELVLREWREAGVRSQESGVRREKNTVAVICGKGNNGGDGFVVARYLREAGCSVKVFLLAPEEEYGGDALVNLNRLPIPALPLHNDRFLEAHRGEIRSSRLIIDALFGTGLDRPIRGFAAQVIRFLNKCRRPVLAVDIPSGLCADTGRVLGEAVYATRTATLHLPKRGLVFGPDSERAGPIDVIPIRIPEDLENRIKRKEFLITPPLFRDSFRPRRRESHKGTYGHALTVAGSRRKIGAPLMAARGALRAGAGLSTLALPECAYEKINSRFAEVMFEPQPDDGEFFSKNALASILRLTVRKAVLVCGPGLGVSSSLQEIIKNLIHKVKIPIILDADALNCLSKNLSIIRGKHPPLILTPHPGEMARLVSASGKPSLNWGKAALSFAKRYKVHLVLKGYRTLVATPDGSLYVNSTGNPGMATAGAGDVLTGVIAGLLAQGFSPETAALSGVWIHGRAGDLVAKKKGQVGMVAWDIGEEVPYVIREIMAPTT